MKSHTEIAADILAAEERYLAARRRQLSRRNFLISLLLVMLAGWIAGQGCQCEMAFAL